MRVKVGLMGLGVLVTLWLAPRDLRSAIALVSTTDNGLPSSVTGAGASMVQLLGANGRYVVFSSDAANLVTNEANGMMQVYLRDRTVKKTILVSATPDGAACDGFSSAAYLSENGQKLVFASDADDLTPNDDNQSSDIFLRDLATGQTQLLSVNTNGVGGNGDSLFPSVTPDGRYMAFESSASDLVPGDNNLASDIFVRDMESGSIVLASQLPSKVAMAKGVDYELGGISSNGQFVLFSAFCAATGSTAPATKQIFVRDTVAQITLWASSNVVVFNGTAFSGPNCYTPSMAPDGQNLTFVAVSTQSKTLLYHHAFQTGITTCFATNQAAFNQSASDYIAPSLSDDGRFAVYALSAYSNGATNQVYRWDALTGSNTLVSAAMDGAGPGNGDSTAPQITPDARFILFSSMASNLTAQAVSGDYELFLRDMETGTTRLASARGIAARGAGTGTSDGVMTADGRWIAFDSASDQLASQDGNNNLDVFVRDMDTESVDLISIGDPQQNSSTLPALNVSSALGISGDGRFIVFSSTSGLLAPGDTNQIYDIFVRDTLSGGTRLVTANRDGTGTQNGTSPSPASISDDGRFVAFDSYASNLSPLDTNALSDVFVRDMWNNSNILASVNRYGVAGGYSLAPLMTPDGKFVLFSSANRQLSSETAAVNDSMLYAFDISAKTNALTTPTNLNITLTTHKSDILSASKDRRVVAVGFGTYGFGAYDFQARNFLFSTNAPKYAAALSGDGKRLAYIINATGNTLTLKLYDLNARIQMASLSAGSMNKICVNSDGSRIAYELSADVAHQKPWAQVYVWDTASGSNFLASASGVDEVRGNGHSHLVAITPDGNRVVFNSQASDLVSGDENGLTDVFMRDLTTGKTVLLSENRSHTGSGNSLSAATALSADGTTVVFDSMASDLIANDFNNAKDVFFVRLPADEPVLRMIEVFVQADGAVRLAWISVPGRTYRVQFKDDCNDPAWKDMAEDVLASESTSLKLDRVKLQTQRYYRVMQLR